MKKLLTIALLLVVVGCSKKNETTDTNTTTTIDTALTAPSAPTPPAGMAGKTDVSNQKSSLDVTNASFTLKSANPVDSSIVELSCGCHFNFIVEGFMGDTTAIKYKQFDAKTAQSHRVGVRFNGNPKAEKGAHEVKLAFLSTGNKGDYRDTITVKYNL